MMKIGLAGGMVAVAMLVAQPAYAGWKVAVQAQPVAVANSTLTVVPTGVWNISSRRPTRQGEVWTIDGFNLNEMAFFGGVAAGQPIFREVDRRNRPLPKFSSSMLLTDVVQFYESSVRVALNTANFTVDQVQPVTWLGQSGVSFSFHFVPEGDGLIRRGEARAVVIDGKLFMATYTAMDLHYFNRDVAIARGIMDSATIGGAQRNR